MYGVYVYHTAIVNRFVILLLLLLLLLLSESIDVCMATAPRLQSKYTSKNRKQKLTALATGIWSDNICSTFENEPFVTIIRFFFCSCVVVVPLLYLFHGCCFFFGVCCMLAGFCVILFAFRIPSFIHL